MEVPDKLLCLFTTPVKEQNDSFVIEIPHQEVAFGEVTENEIYRIALFPSEASKEPDRDTTAEFDMDPRQASQKPPVDEGDRIDVEIEDIGDQGDGIARVGPGYVVIVPDTDLGERVTVEITEVRENVAFAEVREREDRFG